MSHARGNHGVAATRFHPGDLQEPALCGPASASNHGQEMAERSTRGTDRTLFRLALVGALGLVAIAPTGCAASQAGPAASSSGTSASSPPLPAGIAQRPSVRDLMTMLTRSGVGPDQVVIDLTYAPPIFFEVTGLQPPAEVSLRPTLAFMLQETIHDGVLPTEPWAVLLVLETGARAGPYDVRVTATDPHHRTTRLLFPDTAEGSATSQAPGRERTVKLVVPLADGRVSAANTFEWRLPIEWRTPKTSAGASQ